MHITFGRICAKAQRELTSESLHPHLGLMHLQIKSNRWRFIRQFWLSTRPTHAHILERRVQTFNIICSHLIAKRFKQTQIFALNITQHNTHTHTHWHPFEHHTRICKRTDIFIWFGSKKKEIKIARIVKIIKSSYSKIRTAEMTHHFPGVPRVRWRGGVIVYIIMNTFCTICARMYLFN